MKLTLKDVFRFHFTEHALFYVSLFVFPVFLGLIFVFGEHLGLTGDSKYEEVRKWREVNATVVSSEVWEIDSSDETSFSTKLTAKVRFEYRTSEGSQIADYSETWTRHDHRNWSEYLAPSKTLKIRVSPDDPSVVSLLEHNGIP
ncbi:MAG: DUF3592 domain-containing protein [Luteolibacter sp.]